MSPFYTQIFEKIYEGQGVWLPFYSDIEKFYVGEEVCLPSYSNIRDDLNVSLLLRYLRKYMEERKCVCPSTHIVEKVFEGEGVCLPFYSDIREIEWR